LEELPVSPFDALWCDEIPDDVLRLIERFERSTEEAREAVESQAAQVRARAEAEIDGIRQRADEAVRAQAHALAQEVRPLLEGYLRAGKLGEALAVRERLRRLRTCLTEVLADPGVLQITPADYGKTFLYEVTGQEAQFPNAQFFSAAWGTEVYSGDSSLSAACVHAGVLRPGERGTVKVTVLDKPHHSFQGSSRNGVTTWPWQGAWPAFRVSRA
jgi:hypothetical protein